ncbi:beta-1,4-mannosyl-glycoprotein 4-beta-N-acetylglucosaminyltransferase a isoform X2 [Denticeps clupeoides]|uniref:Beta-1,4-mannosyl-glycoprotein 4-beta-N-acetylglucosaminyltransferase n=2 Tax=Denticeps clupeoides TaxID=299321 RepID=A0AAY4AP42_9TELE|nr:beta-1,4-mannosyl-glycoprotein 4-beta-N-acetylglucosaminyltransferase-like isoform X2 [Denticeps clupeoides]XP_028843727.1 beta-1,4-mannosyl-glycoprotein 4-beta-N-acetylglucosaminyltransferase-like isoform X2 [Denticeps clupeoides]XP_028843728.1 beta-1,4-mannosyl-glycoprotein 4-beta-N-acetylglucosaminyltransferase-like isoform X2 [Denticeps clupeoides]XP_028843729.1 beta-1,4-mannosyl-glycoprotein 4-beta-N-acetylglucosaminyltransferase-like isoform X2 [Denticeps clupeoides]XP_028843731.1 beta
MKKRCQRVFTILLVGLCMVSFFQFYKALHHMPLLQHLSNPSQHLRQIAMFREFLWKENKHLEDGSSTSELTDATSGQPDLQSMPWTPYVDMAPQASFRVTGVLHQRMFQLHDDPKSYFVHTKSRMLCFQEGTKMDVSGVIAGQGMALASQREKNTFIPAANMSTFKKQVARCQCRQGWHGPSCGIPTVVQHSNLPTKSRLVPRVVPRRVINALNINHEFDLLHVRFHELADAVDVFMVCESNYTAYGRPRKLLFLQQLLNGTFDYVKHKVLYVFLDHFPKGGRHDGWIADDYLRTFLTKNGMSRIKGARPDDVFIINDADEVPSREAVLFLKLFDGWTEPFGLHMRKSLYGFFWRQLGTLDILSGCTVGMLMAVYKCNGILLRRREYYTLPDFRTYEKTTGRMLLPWSVGSPVHYAGWHCSWCFKPEGVYYKLISAQNGDFPRWGDFKEKQELSYIRELIRTGGWFDGSVPEYPPTNPKEHMFAPKYLLDNYERYKHLLENVYVKHEDKT